MWDHLHFLWEPDGWKPWVCPETPQAQSEFCTTSFHLSAGNHLGGDSKGQEGWQGPVQQLLGHRVPVVVGQEVDPLVPEAEVSQQPLHNGGLLEDGVAMGPLQKWERGPSESLTRQEPTGSTGNAPREECGNMEHGKQQLVSSDPAAGMSCGVHKATGALSVLQRGQGAFWSPIKSIHHKPSLSLPLL